jgi:hypothetical protein
MGRRVVLARLPRRRRLPSRHRDEALRPKSGHEKLPRPSNVRNHHTLDIRDTTTERNEGKSKNKKQSCS